MMISLSSSPPGIWRISMISSRTSCKSMSTAWFNNSPLSYKRLVPGYEAPVYISYGLQNRSALIRVPSARGKATRIEYRSPDPTCNPYLAFAVMLEAGMDGIKNKIDPGEPIEINISPYLKKISS